MARFTARLDTTLPTDAAWQRLTNWPRHGDFVPFTRVTIETPPPHGLGTMFNGRTRLGRVGFDDPMEIVEWEPPTAPGQPGRCRIEKRGTVMIGWAELSVAPNGKGATATWLEDITVARLPKALDPVSAVSSKLLFSRVMKRLLDSP